EGVLDRARCLAPRSDAARGLRRYGVMADMGTATLTRTRTAPAISTSGQLKGKVALVTGSTSGIGLGIARALAQAGSNILLNGFREAGAIERERAQIAEEFGV